METMEKEPLIDVPAPAPAPVPTEPPREGSSWLVKALWVVGFVSLANSVFYKPGWKLRWGGSPYGKFPEPNDPFRFIPCTDATLPPALDDVHPERSWAALFDPNPEHWSWGNATTHDSHRPSHEHPHNQPHEHGDHLHHHGRHHDPYAGRGIYLCGYLDVPLDYTNKSDPRIARLAVTKYQVSGLARLHDRHRHDRHRHDRHRHDRHRHDRGHCHGPEPAAGRRSERTIVIEPGGPGGSGTSMAWRASEEVTKRLSDGKYDVLGWDPRGVNASLPAVSCFPHDVNRDNRDNRALLADQYREVSRSPRAQLQFADAMYNAIFKACYQMHGDLARFVSTAFVARDLEEIRLALGEDELTGYLVGYGTGIGQTYANMFPNSVGRMILDGTEYVKDHRLVGGFGWTALDNATDAWKDGFLGECINAGPGHCALARPVGHGAVTLDSLQARMEALLRSLIPSPILGYTNASGPLPITYPALVQAIYGALYNAKSWPSLAEMLLELETGNAILTSIMLERSAWEYDRTRPPPPNERPSSDELGQLVICADSYDAPDQPEGLDWWESLWANMTQDSWIAGNSRFFSVFPCRHFVDYWPKPAEVYRGDLNITLRNPVLLIAETYDPATPLRNGRRLLKEMGKNARLVAHHGYGHSSRDASDCTDTIARRFILEGTLPYEQETACFANEKPYLYGVKEGEVGSAAQARNPVEAWVEHLAELAVLNPKLLPKKGRWSTSRWLQTIPRMPA